jgi:hypothetical protein
VSDLVSVPAAFGGVPVAKVGEQASHMKALVYGRPGAGKTWLVSQASKVPAMSPVLYMCSDQTERDTLLRAAPDAHAAVIARFQDYWDIYDEAAKGIRNPGLIPFRTFIIDTGTEAERMWMRDIMLDLVSKGSRPGGGEINIDVPSVREWGQSSSGMRRVIRAFRDLPINFIVTAHEKTDTDNSGTKWFKPDFPGKLAHQASGMFSCVWYVYVRAETEQEPTTTGRTRTIVVSEQRLLLTGYTEGFVCKTRADTLPRVVENPDMAKLFEAVTGRGAIDGLPIIDSPTDDSPTVDSTSETE